MGYKKRSHLNDQDEIRKYYLQRGPYQPLQHEFE